MEERNTNTLDIETNGTKGTPKRSRAKGIFIVALIPAENGAENLAKVTKRVPVRISIEGEVAPFGREGSAASPGSNATARLLPDMSAEVKVHTARG